MTDRMQDDYVHVDTHARLVAEAVAGAYEAAAAMFDQDVEDMKRDFDPYWEAEIEAKRIRALTPDDAKAALEAAKAEAFRQGMLRSAEIAREITEFARAHI